MSQWQTSCTDDPDRQLDVSALSHERRATAWYGGLRKNFPGLSVTVRSAEYPVGRMERVSLGPGELVAINSMPALVRYHPESVPSHLDLHLSLMLQVGGSTTASQADRECTLQQGDMCLMDECSPFQLSGEGCSQILFLRMPRRLAMGRLNRLENQCGLLLPASEPGNRLLADMLVRMLFAAPHLAEPQRVALIGSAIHMLGLAQPVDDLYAGTEHWRVRHAIEFIERNCSVAGLRAEEVAQAQGVSRRRLDQLMRAALGRTVCQHLWARRLARASADLRDPAQRQASIAQVAFANGFEDAAHFTRAFKRIQGVTPTEWRAVRALN